MLGNSVCNILHFLQYKRRTEKMDTFPVLSITLRLLESLTVILLLHLGHLGEL